jgi:alginate O-acetyltransferase complex protein AlgI
MITQLFSLALWLAGIGHFCILGASVQVPARLGWKTDLARLTPFNRKLMWTYGGFTVLTIIAFGTLTLALHSEFLRGDPSAMGLAAFIGLYWTARIGVDLFYFDHTDWPKGTRFIVGHILLTGLFAALAATYIGVIAWRLFGR